MKKIVYTSNTGHTEGYAKLLAKKLNIEFVSLKDYKKNTNDQVIYLGWLLASSIQGYKKIKKANPVCVIAVGLNAYSEEYEKSVKEKNNITCDFHFIRGGVDFTKLKGMNKMILKMVVKKLIEKNPGNKEFMDLYNGKDYVSEDSISPIAKTLKK
jgi:menaquinone-dependent protoporphyrinogen IX oxidase